MQCFMFNYTATVPFNIWMIWCVIRIWSTHFSLFKVHQLISSLCQFSASSWNLYNKTAWWTISFILTCSYKPLFSLNDCLVEKLTESEILAPLAPPPPTSLLHQHQAQYWHGWPLVTTSRDQSDVDASSDNLPNNWI